MSAEVLLYLLTGWQPLPHCHPPNFPYSQLPTEQICERCFHQCESDQQALAERLDLVGGWQRQQLAEARCQNEGLRSIWYAAWWVTWPRATAEQREEWASVLQGHLGADAFWRG